MPRIAKTFVLVVLLTALIWAWAEQSQITMRKEQPRRLTVRMPEGWLVLAGEGNSAKWLSSLSLSVTASFIGPQSGISELDRIVKQFDFSLPVPKEGAGQVELDLVEVVKNQPILTRLHTGVSEVEPGTAVLRVAQLKKYTLDVVPVYSDVGTRQAECKPDKVTVHLPNVLYAKLAEKAIRAPVRVDSDTDLTQPIVVELPTELDGYSIHPDPPRVTVVTNLVMTEHKVENVPVMPSYPRDFPWQDYRLDSEKHQWRKTIAARGPADKTLAARDIQVFMKFEMNDIKPTAVPLSRDVEIVLPSGFQLVSPKPGDSERAINFRFVKPSEERSPP